MKLYVFSNGWETCVCTVGFLAMCYGCLLWFNAMVHGAGLSVSGTTDLSRPSDSEGIGSIEEGDGRHSTTVGFKASDGGQAQQLRSKEHQQHSE